jgi:hypothetical protein
MVEEIRTGPQPGRRGVLSRQEQQAWDDIQQHWAVDVEEPWRTTRASGAPGYASAAVTIGARIAILLLLFGAVPVALAVGVATALGWALSRSRRPQPSGETAWATWPRTGKEMAAYGRASTP